MWCVFLVNSNIININQGAYFHGLSIFLWVYACFEKWVMEHSMY